MNEIEEIRGAIIEIDNRLHVIDEERKANIYTLIHVQGVLPEDHHFQRDQRLALDAKNLSKARCQLTERLDSLLLLAES